MDDKWVKSGWEESAREVESDRWIKSGIEGKLECGLKVAGR